MARPPGYRYGSWLVLHGSGAHLVGFSTASWLSRDSTDTVGLWSRCQLSHCDRLWVEHVPDWLVICRVLACVGVVLIVMWLLIGCQCQCLRSRQQRHKWMIRLEELFAVASGCTALLSVGVFAVASASDVTLNEFSLSWSLWLVVGGASASTLGGFIVAITRFPAHSIPKPTTRTIGPIRNPAEGAGISPPSAHPRQVPGNVGDERRLADVTDIFNVASFSSGTGPEGAGSQAVPGRNSPYCWTETGRSPPPYSLAISLGGPARDPGGQTGAGDGAFITTHVHELSLSPPPSYESVFNDPPPPYQYTPPPRVRSSVGDNIE